jgi:hypothetical protein
MSRRGRAKGSAVSLFAFQDIITSVTAIMILLVLILTLELITRSQQRGVSVEDRRVARELGQNVTALEERADLMRAELVAIQSAAGRAASFSEAETRRRTKQADELAAQVAEEVELLEGELRKAGTARRNSERELLASQAGPAQESVAHLEAMNDRAIAMELANTAERERQAETRVGPTQAAAATFVFNASRDTSLEPRLVEVAGNGLSVLEAGAPQPRRFSGPGPAFNRWLAERDAGSEYVVVILRPSGIKLYNQVLEAVRKAGLAVGAELVGESMAVGLGSGG